MDVVKAENIQPFSVTQMEPKMLGRNGKQRKINWMNFIPTATLHLFNGLIILQIWRIFASFVATRNLVLNILNSVKVLAYVLALSLTGQISNIITVEMSSLAGRIGE